MLAMSIEGQLASVYTRQGCYDKALAINPKVAVVLNNLAWLLATSEGWSTWGPRWGCCSAITVMSEKSVSSMMVARLSASAASGRSAAS